MESETTSWQIQKKAWLNVKCCRQVARQHYHTDNFQSPVTNTSQFLLHSHLFIVDMQDGHGNGAFYFYIIQGVQAWWPVFPKAWESGTLSISSLYSGLVEEMYIQHGQTFCSVLTCLDNKHCTAIVKLKMRRGFSKQMSSMLLLQSFKVTWYVKVTYPRMIWVSRW